MMRLIARLIPGAALAVGTAAITAIALRTVARWREEHQWTEAWDTYRHQK